MPEPDLIQQIINIPYFWLVIILICVFFIIRELNRGKTRPEQKPFWGVEVREKMINKQMKKRSTTFSIPTKYNLFWGYAKIGNVKSSEQILSNPDSVMLIHYVGNGLWNSLKSAFGFGLKHILCEPDVLHKEVNNKNLVIDHHAFFTEIAGVWCQSKKSVITFVEQILGEKDWENHKGYVSDFPRRLSNLDPRQAMMTERQELDNELELKKDRSKLDRIMGRR